MSAQEPIVPPTPGSANDPTSESAKKHEVNKKQSQYWQIAGFVLVVITGVAMAVGQELPVFVLCGIGFLAGLGLITYGQKLAKK